jgi:hypothetical protein
MRSYCDTICSVGGEIRQADHACYWEARKPVFWFAICGYSNWLSVVSAMVTAQPSTILRMRPSFSQDT